MYVPLTSSHIPGQKVLTQMKFTRSRRVVVEEEAEQAAEEAAEEVAEEAAEEEEVGAVQREGTEEKVEEAHETLYYDEVI